MEALRQVSWTHRLMAVAMAAMIVFSVKEAWGATSSLRREDCEVTNWCSGPDPQQNCDDCCHAPSTCYSYDPGIQGCLCG